jgi:hypothetical protein
MTRKDQVNKMIGEYTDIPFLSPDPKHNVCNAINTFPTTQHFNWPNELIAHIKQVMGTPCNTPSAPEFKFKLSEEAMKHNLAVLEKYNYNLGQALNAQGDSPLGPGKEFKPPNALQSVFSLHPLWKRMEDFLTHGSKWPLVKISQEEQVNNSNNTLTYGNHKGALAKPKLLLKLISKDVKYGYSILILLDSVKLIPGLEMAPMNILAQNTIDKLGNNPKRLTYPQPNLEVVFRHISQQLHPEGAPAGVSLWLLHQVHCELGSGSKKKISWSENPSVKN